MPRQNIQKFLFPDLNRKFLVRLLIVSAAAVIVFKFILIPFRVSGFSMVPTYQNGDVNFSFTLSYLLTPPQRFDVVTIRLSGRHVMLLKRVVATSGETVAFKNGYLIVNGQKIDEPYVTGRQPWNLAPRMVKKNHVYVVGDNRNVPMQTHHFGQTPVHRIIGGPLW